MIFERFNNNSQDYTSESVAAGRLTEIRLDFFRPFLGKSMIMEFNFLKNFVINLMMPHLKVFWASSLVVSAHTVQYPYPFGYVSHMCFGIFDYIQTQKYSLSREHTLAHGSLNLILFNRSYEIRWLSQMTTYIEQQETISIPMRIVSLFNSILMLFFLFWPLNPTNIWMIAIPLKIAFYG